MNIKADICRAPWC